MNLVEEVHELERIYRYQDGIDRKLTLWLEMAKRIEALEQREHSHPLGVGSYTQRRLDA